MPIAPHAEFYSFYSSTRGGKRHTRELSGSMPGDRSTFSGKLVETQNGVKKTIRYTGRSGAIKMLRKEEFLLPEPFSCKGTPPIVSSVPRKLEFA